MEYKPPYVHRASGHNSLWLKAQTSFSLSRKYSVVRNSEVLEVWVHGMAADHQGDVKYFYQEGLCKLGFIPFRLESENFTTLKSHVMSPTAVPCLIIHWSEVLYGPYYIVLEYRDGAFIKS